MKKAVALIAAIIMFATCLTGCLDRGRQTDKLGERFTCVMHEHELEVWKDNETGVLYWGHRYGNNFGLTVLLDKDGKPLVDEGVER